MATFYLDAVNGLDANDGSSFALAWKTITSGATAARIAPADIIRIAKSPAPTALAGTTATWTDLSKTVTLGSAETANITLVETNWTAISGGDTTPTLVAVATDAKQGSNSVRLTLDAAVQTNVGQAFFATGALDLSAYQKISFWIKNSHAILATHYTVKLCSDTSGATPVDTFIIPAIPSAARWLPVTIARNGGGNLGAAIQSIAIYTDSAAPTNSSNILIDNFIACTSDGLNLQSLISKNTLEQGTTALANYGNEGWYGIQSINGTTVLLDGNTNILANAGRGYVGTTESVNTFKRETIKTALATLVGDIVQDVMDSGTLALGNIEFQGGYDIVTNTQIGETFFDGLNGFGAGLRIGVSFTTFNYVNCLRYNNSITIGSNNTIINMSSSNSTLNGIFVTGQNNIITTISNVNNNAVGVLIDGVNNIIATISNANSNTNGVQFGVSAADNIITTISNARSNGNVGLQLISSNNNQIGNISTSSNVNAAIANSAGRNYIRNATLSESTKVSAGTAFADRKVFINNIGGFSNIWGDLGNIVSQNATAGGTGLEWRMNITDTRRAINYPLSLSVAKIAVQANKAVDVSLFFKKSHATDIEGVLVCRGGQLSGIASDVKTTAPSNTNRNSVALATMTPTESGVLEIEVWSYWVSGAATQNVIVDDINIVST